MTSLELDGVTPPLTAAEAIDLARVAEIMSEIAGREVRRRVASDEEYRAAMIAQGAPEHLMLGMFAASRLGHFAMLDGTLARVIGRAPVTLREALAAS